MGTGGCQIIPGFCCFSGTAYQIVDTAMLLGLPFLVIAWLMLIRFTGSLTGKIGNKWFVFWFLLTNFSVLILVGYFITGTNSFNTSLVIREYYIIMNLIYFFLAAYLIHFPWKGQQVIHDMTGE